jgi:hypothetical protein
MDKTLLDIPFFKNDRDGDQCMQVAMKSVIKYYLDQDYSLRELDKLTQRSENQWTWTPQIVASLHKLGLEVQYFSTIDAQRFVDDRSYFFDHYGNSAADFAEVIDLDVVINSITEVVEKDLFENKKVEISEIESAIDKGSTPMLLINWNILAGEDSEYQGHLVVVTGYDEDHLYYHEPGPTDPEPHKKVEKQLFLDAWDQKETDHDVVIVYGER